MLCAQYIGRENSKDQVPSSVPDPYPAVHVPLTPSVPPSVSELQEDLTARLKQRTELLYQYSKKLKQAEAETELVTEECKRKIRSVRAFWKEKIYSEGSRSGKILKKAMQK